MIYPRRISVGFFALQAGISTKDHRKEVEGGKEREKERLLFCVYVREGGGGLSVNMSSDASDT